MSSVSGPIPPPLPLFEAMKRLSKDSFEAEVYRRHGTVGIQVLLELISAVKEIFEQVPFEMMTAGMTVVAALDPTAVEWAPGGQVLHSPRDLSGVRLQGMTVWVGESRRMQMWPDPDADGNPAIEVLVYRYVHGVTEEVVIAGKPWLVPKSAWPCSMGVPTYSSLEAALTRYVQLNRRPESCAHIEKSWRDSKRLAFFPKPEVHLRRSLFGALQYALSGVMVRQELNQDETRPVDIEVNWWGHARSAIIEVKWLGDSAAGSAIRWSTSYDARRAVSGLVQLADYLKRREGSTPEIPVMGYLFVFDARRQKLSPQTETISKEQALFFQHVDPPYPPELLSPADMGSPYRCFMEPIYSLG